MAVATVHNYTYESTLKAALRVNWQIEDLIGGNKQLDFSKPFLPDSLAQVNEIDCLNSVEKLKLNQIRGNSYLHLFGLVEEFILPLVVDHTQHIGVEDIHATRAFLCFAEEEGKHIHLFRRFAEEFERGFGTPCAGIGPAKAIADAVLQHSTLGVALITLHIEWMTQKHYLESIGNNQAEALDSQFCSLLRHHWLEEAQHARLDTLMVERLAQDLNATGIEQGIADYIAIVKMLHEGLKAQVQLDIKSLETSISRVFGQTEKQTVQNIQEKSYRWTFLESGILHPNFMQTISQLNPTVPTRITELLQSLA